MRTRKNRKDAIATLRAVLTEERNRMVFPNGDALRVLSAPQDVAVEDQAPLLHEQFVALTRHGERRRIAGLIDDALARIDRDEYGICEECDGEIALKRLEAIPWAARCVPCQEQLELIPAGLSA
jgi:DnaK suppressor protein